MNKSFLIAFLINFKIKKIGATLASPTIYKHCAETSYIATLD